MYPNVPQQTRQPNANIALGREVILDIFSKLQYQHIGEALAMWRHPLPFQPIRNAVQMYPDPRFYNCFIDFAHAETIAE
jgi:hypothetical protein